MKHEQKVFNFVLKRTGGYSGSGRNMKAQLNEVQSSKVSNTVRKRSKKQESNKATMDTCSTRKRESQTSRGKKPLSKSKVRDGAVSGSQARKKKRRNREISKDNDANPQKTPANMMTTASPPAKKQKKKKKKTNDTDSSLVIPKRKSVPLAMSSKKSPRKIYRI